MHEDIRTAVQNDLPMRGSELLFRLHEGFIDLAVSKFRLMQMGRW